MVRNWQNRVEQTKERRKQSKKRKEDIGEKRKNKQQVHDFLGSLNKCSSGIIGSDGKRILPTINTQTILHIWTDTIPKDGPVLSDILMMGGTGDSSNNSKRKGSIDKGNNIIAIVETPPRKGGRGGKGNAITPDSNGKKKAHPRSKDAGIEAVSVESETKLEVPLLCRSFFFTGKCLDSGNKSGCRYAHYNNTVKVKTLSQAFNNRHKEEKHRQELQLSDQALLSTMPEDVAFNDPDGMEMIYYMIVPLKFKSNNNNSGGGGGEEEEGAGNNNNKLSAEISQVFSTSGIPLSSIVYVVINETLTFDRYREGLLVSEDELAVLAFANNNTGTTTSASVEMKQQQQEEQYSNNSTGRRTTSIGSSDEGDDDTLINRPEDILVSLPGCILEHILTFSPDQTVAAASQVCKSWYFEIGQNSPNLWKELLERHQWPFPSMIGTTTTVDDIPKLSVSSSQQLVYREAFLQHYVAVRDLTAIKMGLLALTSNSKRSAIQQDQKEMTYQDFSTRKHAPSDPNHCIALRVWSPTRILAAYSRDCSLRLFESVCKGGGGGGGGTELACRELICQKIDPYKNTKRKSCRIVSMDLDDHSIGCLCEVLTSNEESAAYILVLMTRDDFLLGDSSETGMSEDPTVTVFDIGEAVLNHLVSADDMVDHHPLLQLVDFLASGRDVSEVEILVSHTVVACGSGRFMMEVSISIPDDDDDDDEAMLLLGRKLVLFSTSASAIVWVGDSNNPSSPLRPRREDMTIAKMQLRVSAGRSRAACAIVASSSTSPTIILTVIEPSGQIQSLPLEGSDLLWNEITVEGWDAAGMRSRPLIVTELDVVATDVLHQRVDDRILARKTFVSFYRRLPNMNETSYQILQLDGDVEAIRLVPVRDTHAIVVCQGLHNKLDVDRQFEEPEGSNLSLFAIIIDIASRQEIERISLLEDVGTELSVDNWLEFSIDNSSTIGAGLSWKGVVMTGNDVRSLGDSAAIQAAEDLRSNKKKNKKKPRKANKKDLFARGKNT